MIHNPLDGTVAYMKVRLAKLSDAADIAEIYNHEVLSSVATFDLGSEIRLKTARVAA